MTKTETPLLTVRGLRVDIATANGVLTPVRGVDLTVRRGETHAIVGESGCGKSVTALSLLGLLPKSARIGADAMTFADRSLKGLSEADWRTLRGARIAMIFQDPMTSLDPYYTIGDQLVEVLRQHVDITRDAARTRARDLLLKVGISAPDDRLRQYPHQLSGGLRQRVMIAMALLCEPDLIIADEPTTALDVTIQMQILKLLKQIQKDTNIGLVLITHDLGVVASIADTTSVMYGGQIVESGPTAEVLSAPVHPYTIGLLHATPVPGKTRRGDPLGTIPGIVPLQIGDLVQCGFLERCSYRRDGCAVPVPLLIGTDKRAVRCILAADAVGGPAS